LKKERPLGRWGLQDNVMSSAVSLKTTPTDLGASSARVRVNGPLDRIRQIRDAIAHRAYELFQKRGKASGSDQEDWYCAETELIHQVHTTVLETDALLVVFAEIPGFHSDNLVLKVEPRSITIAGQREPLSHAASKKVSCANGCTDRIFLSLALPAEVDPLQTFAQLKDGILELVMPKIFSPAQFAIVNHAYSLVRSKDYRRWTHAVVQLLSGYR
jgi:HSP20 family molecular chaperone IbpA